MLFITSLQETLQKYNLLNHTFYKYWNEGKLDSKTLSEYAAQYYHHVEAFPKALSAIHSNCDSLKSRKIILENLIEEEYSTPNHPQLWLQFAGGYNLDKKYIDNVDKFPETKNLLDVFKTLSKSSYSKGLGALYAHEWQYSDIAKTKKEGLIKHYGFKDNEKLEFFNVHSDIDIWHAEQLVDLIKATDKSTHNEIEEGATQAAKALWGFLDDMLEFYNENKKMHWHKL